MLSRVILRRPARVGFIYQPFTSSYHHDGALAEYTATPQYPPILEVTPEANRRRKKQEWREKVTNLPTVEQKMMELNMPKYHGHWACHLQDTKPLLLSADFCRYATRTHVTQGLPHHYYEEVWQQALALAGTLAGQVEDLILLNYNTKLNRRAGESKTAQSRRQTQNFLYGLHRLVCGAAQATTHLQEPTTHLQEATTHLQEATTHLRPRVEAYWILGGIPPDNMLKKTRRGVPFLKHLEHEPMERSMQGMSTAFLGLCVREGLPAVVGRGDPLATTGDLPTSVLDPRSYGFKFRHKHATTVTGSWPSEGNQHGQLFLHTQEWEHVFKDMFGQHNLTDAFIHKALVACFSQAHAHSTYLGFGAVTELTYPLVQQSAFTSGQRWTLGLYQLNTCALHSDKATQNPYNNILWLSEEQELFEGVDGGGVQGLNTPLLTAIIAMYLKKGVPNPDPTPYLPLKYVAHHPATEEYRDRFHQHYLRLASNRPLHREKPELYLWEKIYKVDFNTRPLDAPSRFYEDYFKRKIPDMRPLDDESPRYIPKSLRKEKRVKFQPKLNSKHLYKYE